MQEIIVEHISKSFGETRALHEVSLEVGRGELFGLIGPDGAGKTTLFQILTSLLIPDHGSAKVGEYDTVKNYKDIRKIVGYMPGRFSLYQDLSVEENLSFFATIFGSSIEENYDLIRDIYVQIEPFKKRRAGKLSGGMKQKLALCCALIHRPRVLFLDEPTTGVDAVSRDEFWTMLKRIKAEGISILVSTPYMDEASLCDRIALIQEGRILAIDSPKRIVDQYHKHLYKVKAADFYQLLLDLRQADFADRVEPFGEFLHLSSQVPVSSGDIEEFVIARGYKDIRIESAKPGIEDVFLDLM